VGTSGDDVAKLLQDDRGAVEIHMQDRFGGAWLRNNDAPSSPFRQLMGVRFLIFTVDARFRKRTRLGNAVNVQWWPMTPVHNRVSEANE
jgi:hypothetical protein